ncbi:MAG: hypothetical protein H0T56_01305 [Pseudaminobacter sp.]|nr:hypothetical protein [Pseudaminobacter sp.]
MAEAVQNGEHLPIAQGIAEEYARGAIGIAVQFDRIPNWNVHDRRGVAHPANELIAGHSEAGFPFGIIDSEVGMPRSSQNGADGAVFVGDIHFVEAAEDFALPAGEGLKRNDEIPNPLAGGLDSIAPGFVIRSVIAARERQVLVLRAAVPPDQRPNHVVKGGAQIVNSVAYYDNEVIGGRFNESYLNKRLSGLRIILDAKSVRLARYKGFELPLKVGNVMLCSFNLH